MTLTHQFLITLTLPAFFLAILVYDWRAGGSRQYGPFWSLTLLSVALWASSLLSYYGGVALPAEAAASWRIAGNHLLSASALGILLSTTSYLGTARLSRIVLTGVALVFWVAAFLLDPALWPWRLDTWSFLAEQNAHFNLWSAFWVTAWFSPLLASMMLARQAEHQAQSALFRNRLNYWQTMLVIFSLGGGLALIQQPDQPAWQELGALGMALAAGIGTLALLRGTLPNLRLAFRHGLARLAASLFILTLTWIFLYLFVNNLPAQGRDSTIIELGLAAAVFTALFSAINRYVPVVVRRLLVPHGRSRSGALADQPELTRALANPEALGEILLHLCQFNIAAEGGRVYLATETSQDTIRLSSVAQIGLERHGFVKLDATGPIVAQLRQRPPTPLSMYELETSPLFAGVPVAEKEQFQQGEAEIIMPLSAGSTLVGVMTLAEKYTGEAYSHADLLWLQGMSEQGGPLLWQARQLQTQRSQLDVVRTDVEDVQRETHRLHELLLLHERFVDLISPALRRPVGDIHKGIDELQRQYDDNGAAYAFDDLNQRLTQLRLMLNRLIVTASRIRRQHDFAFRKLNMVDIVEEVVRDLTAVAEARQVSVKVNVETKSLPILGDEERLHDAMQHLLHNAIRFNKIGGSVDVVCETSNGDAIVHVRDSGIGIAPARLERIWEGPVAIHLDQSNNVGAGLGLLLTRFVVRAHGGDIDVSSSLDDGSTFSLHLPLAVSETMETARV